MKRFFSALAATCAVGVSSGALAVDRVGDFSLLDQKGYFHQLSYYDNYKAVAVLVQAEWQQGDAEAIEAFKQAQAKYQARSSSS